MKKTRVRLAVILVLASGLPGNGLNLNGFGAPAPAETMNVLPTAVSLTVPGPCGISEPASARSAHR